MSKKILQLTCIVVLLAGLLLNVGCVTIRTAAVGDLKTESQSIERGEAESVRAMIRMGVGDLRLSGGASKLLDATFTTTCLNGSRK